ncbi:MAG: hypothetical protein WC490_00835 [Candidatus Margulisiibacteriota bacterium]
MKYISYDKIETLTEQRLCEYESKFGQIVSPPIPIDKIIERLFSLRILWENIHEEDGEVILGGLRPNEKQIVLNDSRMPLFNKYEGLEPFTKGHELGHWDLLEEKDLIGHQMFNFLTKSSFVLRSSSDKDAEKVRVLIANLWKGPDFYKVIKSIEGKKDDAITKRIIDRYASTLLMPKHLIKKVCATLDILSWSDLYKLRKIFNVTISALTVRLQQLNMIYIDNKKIYKSKEDAIGQLALIR